MKHCSTKRCRGRVTEAAHSDKCPKCKHADFREKHPLAYALGNLRRRAKQRGIAFTLTLPQYTRFAIATDYASMKGKTSLSLSCDRMENGLGYHDWNIRAVTMQENSRKQFVPYFNGGKLPAHQVHEYNELERSYRGKMERIAAMLSKEFTPGTNQFWDEFRRRKDALIGAELIKPVTAQ